jgi:hypothetical protein
MLARTALIALLVAGCGAPASEDAQPDTEEDGGAAVAPRGSGGAAPKSDAASGAGGSKSPPIDAGATGGGGKGGASEAGGAAGRDAAFGSVASMRLISRTVPAFASNGLRGNPYEGPELAEDASGYTGWVTHTIPAWLAYDLSAVPAADRRHNVVFWHANNNVYLSNPEPWMKMPIDYVIESSAAPGGTDPPVGGWTTLVTVTSNTRGTVELELDLAGANWIRMRVTTSSDPAGEMKMDMDVFTAPEGATDSWLFMGDSITYMALMYGFSNLPGDVQAVDATRWPAVINAAIGGTGAITAVDAIAETIKGYPGRFVALAYGTNDHADGFGANMETLVKDVIAAGKVPVVPRMIWADSKLTEGPIENAAIDDLYKRYPAILKGPDLWTVFENRTDLIAPGDVHPNDAGQKVLRAEWVKTILAVP